MVEYVRSKVHGDVGNQVVVRFADRGTGVMVLGVGMQEFSGGWSKPLHIDCSMSNRCAAPPSPRVQSV